MHQLPEHTIKLRNRMYRGILVTALWMLLAGLCVQYRDHVPSITEFKGNAANFAACATTDVVKANQCLDDKYAQVMASWRTDTGLAVVLPPMLAWIAVLLNSLSGQLGLFRRRQRA